MSRPTPENLSNHQQHVLAIHAALYVWDVLGGPEEIGSVIAARQLQLAGESIDMWPVMHKLELVYMWDEEVDFRMMNLIQAAIHEDSTHAFEQSQQLSIQAVTEVFLEQKGEVASAEAHKKICDWWDSAIQKILVT